MEFVKGELSVKDTNEHGDYYIGNKDSYSYIAIVVAEVLSPENSAEEYAQEFVRRWNAFEKDGLVDELRTVVTDMLCGLKYLRQTNEIPYGFGIDRLEKTGLAAIAKVKA